METKSNRLLILFLTALAAIGGAVLRKLCLACGMTEEKLLIDDAAKIYPILLCIVIGASLLCVALLLLRFEKYSSFDENFYPHIAWKLPVGLAGVLITAGELLTFQKTQDDLLLRLTCLLGIIGGLALLALAAVQMLEKRGSFLFLLPLCIWAAMQLICDYKQWSKDPILLDYCFRMLASITGMLSIFHVGGFFFDSGKRRLTIFWCAACVIFCAVSLPDCTGSTVSLLYMLALLLFTGSVLIQLVFRKKLDG